MTFRSSAVSSPLRFRSRFPLTSLALAAVVATLAACAQTPAGPQASQASPVIATTPAPAPAPAQPAAPQPLPAAGLSPSEEQIVPRQYANNPKVDAFINEVAARDGLDPARLRVLFATANYSATAVKLVRPAPSPSVKNWRVYQSRFLDTIRINAGVKFWRANQATLQRASAEFGVPPEVIVGIIGVETIYGRYMGNFPALDALTTLAFDYPDTPNRADRQATFRKNLEDFLVWTRDSQIDPTSVVGSYTGAIGIPQFLPSSIRAYAVDYEGNGHIDLRASTADAIGSVANYLKQHGWQPGRPVVWEIAPDAGSQGVAQAAADGKPEPHLSLSQLTQAGLTLDEPSVDVRAEAGTPVTVVDLPSPNRATEYKLGLQNFYVLTRYNRSFFYALAVYQLGERVKQKMLATQ
ncbi:lytic murein transglycosylase B [Burkholderia gladioli]|uniref:lytic murein transglycosylase B n=1 Tax=Burkholderia gladioli TaxID=28095 RepID=UPI00163EC88B|nr:lytic murein transglycosylase B [Burkholderia gladioli]